MWVVLSNNSVFDELGCEIQCKSRKKAIQLCFRLNDEKIYGKTILPKWIGEYTEMSNVVTKDQLFNLLCDAENAERSAKHYENAYMEALKNAEIARTSYNFAYQTYDMQNKINFDCIVNSVPDIDEFDDEYDHDY